MVWRRSVQHAVDLLYIAADGLTDGWAKLHVYIYRPYQMPFRIPRGSGGVMYPLTGQSVLSQLQTSWAHWAHFIHTVLH